MGAGVIRRSVILPPVQGVRKCAASLAVRHRLAIRIGRKKIQTMAGALLNLDLQGVIAGIVAIAGLVDTLTQLKFLKEKPPLIPIAASENVAAGIQRGLIDIGIDKQ